MTDENAKTTSTGDSEAEERPERAIVTTGADALEATEGGDELADDDGSTTPTQLGATRYVLAAFFAAGMAATFLVSKSLNAGWNRLTNNPWISQHLPFLSRISEDDRPSYTMLVGAVAGVVATVYAYRRADVRTWTNEVAAELAKVSWPSKKEVTNSTMVVIVTSAFATVFLALLDRFWGFVTNLVYGS